MRRWVRSASLTNYAEVAREAGLDALGMLREFGLPPSCLTQTELKLPIGAVRNLLEASAERSDFEAFGLRMAETRRLAHLGPLGLLVREQPTMHRALEALARYANRLNQALFLTLEDAGDVVVLREEIIVGDSGPIRQSTELAIGVVFCTLKALLGKAWKPRRVCFAHDMPADCSVHDRVFGRIVEFGHDFNGIVCARSDLEIPNPAADPVMARYAQDLVDASVAHRPGADDEVRETIVTLLAVGKCTIEEAARRLGTNRRTLHRRLAKEGQTFRAILDDVRSELASRYVADHHRSLAEISELLGFAAPTGFSRWYRRHFKHAASNQRPGRARKRLPVR